MHQNINAACTNIVYMLQFIQVAKVRASAYGPAKAAVYSVQWRQCTVAMGREKGVKGGLVSLRIG